MRTARVMTLLLAAALPLAATAQTSQQTASQTQPATGPAADLQAYVLMLQDSEARLAKARQTHAEGRTSSQTGAFSQERIDLMQTIRAAWRDMQKVPASYKDNEAYQSAEKKIRADLDAAGPDRSLSKEKADQAAQDALQTLADLRGKVAQAAAQAGAPVPAPQVQGGGTPR